MSSVLAKAGSDALWSITLRCYHRRKLWRYVQRTERETVVSTATDVPFVAPVESQATADQPADQLDLIEAAKLAIYTTRRWTRVDKNGHSVPDDGAARNFVYEYFRDNAVVNSEADIVDDGLSSADLYAKTFPSAPGSTSEPVDEVEFLAYRDVSRKLWQWAGTGIKSHCQETAELEGLDYVMVEKKVFRATRDTTTGTGAPKSVMVRFFTSNPDLIFQLSSQPAAAKLVKAAEDASKHLQMNTRRHPELLQRVARETQSALKRSTAHLAPVAAARASDVGALPAGNGDDN
jgi:hypothetical protein